jgi:eukaryotic-like serine/threonine-protein kinase
MPETSPAPTRLLAGHDPHRLAALALMAEPVADAADAADTAEDADKPWTTFGGIDLHEEIGRGGMGVVYRARQRALDRIVAVKVLLRAQFASKEERARFHREAQAAARLRHPSIVTVHEVGEDEGVPWFSMDFIPGKSLEQVVRDYPMAERTAALCVQKISAAIQHAHEHGVLHRDLKPSNILLDAHDEPHITDFGIARIMDGTSTSHRYASLTQTGQALGSPGYSAPEQALHGRADERTDVYGLGALLYHLLTGRPPFQGSTLEAILVQLREGEPLPPRRLNPSVHRDLETICLKCLKRSPLQRYKSGREVELELGRFLAGQPIEARPAGALERVWRWTIRHPSVTTIIITLALLLVALVGGALHLAHEGQITERAVTLLAEGRQNRMDVTAGSRGRALSALREAWSLRPSQTIRDEVVAATLLHDAALTETLEPDHPSWRHPPLNRSRDGSVEWRMEQDTVLVADLQSGVVRGRIPLKQAEVLIKLDDNGQRIAIAQKADPWTPCVVTIHEIGSGRELYQFSHRHAVTCLDWAGELLATGGSVDRLVHVWDTRSGQRLHRLSGHDSDPQAVIFRPDGQELISLAADYRVRVWHAATGQELLRMEQVGAHGAPAWWDADGRRLYTRRDKQPQVDVITFDWSPTAKTLNPGRDEARSENLLSIHSNHAGELTAAVDEMGCRVWDWKLGRERGFVAKQGGEWMTAQLSDATGLWISSWNHPLRRRPLQRDERGWWHLLPHQRSVLLSGPLVVAARSDGMAFASTQASADDTPDWVEVWNEAERKRIELQQSDPYCAALSPNGQWCITGSYLDSNVALLWRLPEGRLETRLSHQGNLNGIKFTNDGKKVWLWGNAAIQCLETTHWKPLVVQNAGSQNAVTVSPDGRLLAQTGRNLIQLLNASNWQVVASLPLPTRSSTQLSLNFSGDSRFLFVHAQDGTVVRWDTMEVMDELRQLRGHQ